MTPLSASAQAAQDALRAFRDVEVAPRGRTPGLAVTRVEPSGLRVELRLRVTRGAPLEAVEAVQRAVREAVAAAAGHERVEVAVVLVA